MDGRLTFGPERRTLAGWMEVDIQFARRIRGERSQESAIGRSATTWKLRPAAAHKLKIATVRTRIYLQTQIQLY